jgi:ribosomal protein S18 acetylase RimI-like enzyme
MSREARPQIDSATSADLAALVALLGELFRLEQDFAPDAARQRRALELLLSEPQRAIVLVACAPQVVGMISVQLVTSTAEGGHSAWIEDVVVDARYRGRGIGRALVTAALAWARERGATRAQLLVDTGNGGAIEFYAKLGWHAMHLTPRRMFLEHQ